MRFWQFQVSAQNGFRRFFGVFGTQTTQVFKNFHRLMKTFERGFWRMALFFADFIFSLIDFFERLCVSFETQITQIFKIFTDC